jgi:hypothetical protein
MRNKHAISRMTVTLFIAAALAMSALTIAAPRMAAAVSDTLSAGNGEGSIIYSAHRAPGNWGPTFTGANAQMYFVVYDSSFGLVTNGHADERGVLITGLQVGGTYFLSPENCEDCHGSTHDVIFNNWEDCSTERQRMITIAADQRSYSATYRIVEQGEPDVPVPCSPGSPTEGGSTGGTNEGGNTGGNTGGDNTGGTTDNGGTSTGGTNNNGASNVGSFETGVVDPIFYFKLVGFLNNEFSATTIAAEDGTAAAADAIPSTNLSGKPLDSDPSLTYAEYNSLYEVIRADPLSASQTTRAAVDAGIPWEHLSDMQKAYIILKVRGSQIDQIALTDLGLE